MTATAAALALSGITKRFGGIVANDGIDFTVARGEVRALLGENGAGKTTLMRILYGLTPPDAGTIRLAGKRVRFRSPHDAIRSGLGMVHQHFMLFPSLTVAENVVFGREPRRGGLVDRRRAITHVRALAERHGLAVDPEARVGDLAVGVRQRVEILKLLHRDANILILDEPSAVLTPQETEGLFAMVRSLADQGRTIVFITHKLREVEAVADRATVLRRGKTVGTVDVGSTSRQAIAALMVGDAAHGHLDRAPPSRPDPTTAPPVLDARGLVSAGAEGRGRLHGLDLAISAGEIVGIAGVAGNGQRALVETLVGLRRGTAGTIRIDGREVTRASIAQRRAAGMAHVPEDRGGRGLALDASLRDNLLPARTDLFRRPNWLGGQLDRGAAERWARDQLDRFGVRPNDPMLPASALSGGHQQKLILARELAGQPRLLIAEQPTRGVDLAAAREIHRLLIAARDEGAAVLVVAAEPGELITLCDRILVMLEGRFAGVLGTAATEAQIAWLAAGGEASA